MPDPQPPQPRAPEDLDFEVPTPIEGPTRRSPTVSAAAGALAIAGLFSMAGAGLVATAGGSTSLIGFAVAFGVVQLSVALLVFRLQPLGRSAGIGVAIVGLAFGVSRLIDGTGVALLELIAYGFVLWVLATSGRAFRRR